MALSADKLSNIRSFYDLHEKRISVGVFVFGFVLDWVSLTQFDSLLDLALQAFYLVLAVSLVMSETYEQWVPPERRKPLPRWMTAWGYRQFAIHFALGSLLSVYTVFYFKSASGWSALLFLGILAGLLLANESDRFKEKGLWLRLALTQLCLLSYFLYVVPLVIGFVGRVPFTLSVLLGLGAAYGLIRWLHKREVSLPILKRQVAGPLVGVPLVVVALYWGGMIPPVPITLKGVGIYHEIRKGDGNYELVSTRPRWKFWQSGDQTFLAQPGDRIFCFVRIASPSRFADQVKVRWLYHDPKRGWQSSDAIPMKISGGREEGFRGYTYKSNYQPGEWRVQIETTDGREVGRIGFEVISQDANTPRDYHIEVL